MPVIYLALGSNLGDREQFISQALDELPRVGIHLTKTASIIETDPCGGPPQNKYLNTVVEAKTDLSPRQLLATILEIENKLGRIRTVKDGPRTIDIDILLYDNRAINEPGLTVPHPRMFERDFVMRPLKEIAPHIQQHNAGHENI